MEDQVLWKVGYNMKKIKGYWNKEEYRKQLEIVGYSLTDESYKAETDIYTIIAGMAPSELGVMTANGNYGIAIPYHFADWQDIKASYNRDWLKLNPELRKQFGTPANFLAYCSNPENYIVDDGKVMFLSDYEKMKEEERLKELEAAKKELETIKANNIIK